MIEIRGVTHRYGHKLVLDRIDLTVGRGETLVLMGPNGAGKSTLLSIVAGRMTPVRGEVRIDGHVRRGTLESEVACRRMVFYSHPDSKPYGYMTVEEWLLEIAAVYGVPKERAESHVEQLLPVFDLDTVAHNYSADISTGQSAKLRLCGALVSDAPVLVLDEPFSGGMDPSGLLAARSILSRLASTGSRTMLLASPVPEDIEQLDARVALLHGNRIAEEDTIHGLTHRTDPPCTLAEAYSRILNPEIQGRTEKYMEGMPGAHGD